MLIALAIPFSAHAAENPTLDLLLAQVAILQNQLASLTGTATTASCTPIAYPLSPGQRGADVSRLQQLLARDPLLYPEGEITGYYGQLTLAAVRRLQVSNAIVSAGTPETTGFGAVGVRTLAVVNRMLCPPVQVPAANVPEQQSQTLSVQPVVTNVNAIVPVSATVSVSTSAGSASVALGTGLSISWSSTSTPSGSTVRLTLLHADGTVVDVIDSGKAVKGDHFWTLPLSTASTRCAGSAIECIEQLFQPCTGRLCSLEPGAYVVRADVVHQGAVLAQAKSAVFRVTSATASSGSSTNSLADVAGLAATPVSTGSGASSAGSLTSDALALLGALGSAGTASSTTPPQTPTATINGSCRTPWGSQVVTSGNQITYEPFFTGGTYTGAATNLLMQCSSGSWMKCDWSGDNCAPFSVY